MAVEVIHEHDHTSGDSGMGFFLGLIVLIIFLAIFVTYILPLLRNAGTPAVNVPGNVNVNLHQTK